MSNGSSVTNEVGGGQKREKPARWSVRLRTHSQENHQLSLWGKEVVEEYFKMQNGLIHNLRILYLSAVKITQIIFHPTSTFCDIYYNGAGVL